MGTTMDKQQQNHRHKGTAAEATRKRGGGALNTFFGSNLRQRKLFSVNKLCL